MTHQPPSLPPPRFGRHSAASMAGTGLGLLLCAVLLAAAIGTSDAAWCVCRSDVSDGVLQKAIDYACGTGADCMPILQNGACFQPNTVRSHCSWAVNSYYQRRSSLGATCDFSGAATLSNSDPSFSSCSFPASASAAGTSGTTPSSTSTTSTGGTTTNGFTPGVLGLGPSGASFSPDSSDAVHLLTAQKGSTSLFVAATLSALVLLRN